MQPFIIILDYFSKHAEDRTPLADTFNQVISTDPLTIFVDVFDHILYFFLGGILAKISHHSTEFTYGDSTIAIFVK
jgi:hypothetical protein